MSPAHQQELKKLGKQLSFAEVSQSQIVSADSSSCVGKVLSNPYPSLPYRYPYPCPSPCPCPCPCPCPYPYPYPYPYPLPTPYPYPYT